MPELLMTMIIGSILAIGTYLAWPTITINLGAQADLLADEIRSAQAFSMSKGQRFRFVSTSTTQYQITDGSGNPITLYTGQTTGTLTTNVTFGAFTNLPNNLIVFDTAGNPYSDTLTPGTALSSAATIPVTAGGLTKNIVISPGTGRVIVQ